MLPSIEYSWNYILQDCDGNSATDWIEVVAEVILGEHGVGWVAAVWVIPHHVLLVCRGIDNSA